MTHEAISITTRISGDVRSPSWQLFTFTDAVFRATEPREIYEAALDAIQSATGCERSIIALSDGGEPDILASRGLSEDFLATLRRIWTRRGGGAHAEPLHIENTADWDAPDAFKAIASSEGVHSVSFIPVIQGGEVKGQFVLCFDGPHNLGQPERLFALAVARQFAFAIERMAAEAARARVEERLLYLAAMVESSDDAIVTKNLDGVITSWNFGAELMFGYKADEAIGKPITIIIPEERHEEEQTILARLRSGQRIDHFETLRKSRDGKLIDISLTVSPVKDPLGNVIGASKIARDISDRRRAAHQQDVMLRELHHRVRNLFALAATIVTMTARRARSVDELADAACRRLQSLAVAQSLTMRRPLATEDETTSLRALLDAVLKPFRGSLDETDGASISIEDCDAEITNKAATALALVIHELATNAVKYGGLGLDGHGVAVVCHMKEEHVVISWRESAALKESGGVEGFGSKLIAATVEQQLCGRLKKVWDKNGLAVVIEIPLAKLREH